MARAGSVCRRQVVLPVAVRRPRNTGLRARDIHPAAMLSHPTSLVTCHGGQIRPGRLGALVALRGEAMFPRERGAGGHGRLMVAVTYAWRSPTLGPVLLGNVIVGLFVFNFPTFFATLSTLTFQQPELFGIAESINALAAVLTGLLLARCLRVPTVRMVGLACAALGVTLAWVALAPTPMAFLASMPFFGAAVVAYTATAQSLTQRQAPREMVGRMMSLFTLGSMGTTPLEGLIVGLVTDLVSPRAAVGLGAASAILVGLVLVLRGDLRSDEASNAQGPA